MKQRLLSLFIAVFGIAAGAQAQSANSVYVGTQSLSDGTYEAGDLTALAEGSITYNSSQKLLGVALTRTHLLCQTIGKLTHIDLSHYSAPPFLIISFHVGLGLKVKANLGGTSIR